MRRVGLDWAGNQTITAARVHPNSISTHSKSLACELFGPSLEVVYSCFEWCCAHDSVLKTRSGALNRGRFDFKFMCCCIHLAYSFFSIFRAPPTFAETCTQKWCSLKHSQGFANHNHARMELQKHSCPLGAFAAYYNAGARIWHILTRAGYAELVSKALYLKCGTV